MDKSQPPTVAPSDQPPHVHQDGGVGPQTVQPTLPLSSNEIWNPVPMQTVNLQPIPLENFQNSGMRTQPHNPGRWPTPIGPPRSNVPRPTLDTLQAGTSSDRPYTSYRMALLSSVRSSSQQSIRGSSSFMAQSGEPLENPMAQLPSTTLDTLQAGSQQTAYGTSSGHQHSSNPMLLQSAVASSSQQFIGGSSNSMAAGTSGYYAQSVGGHPGSQLRNNSLNLTSGIGPPGVNATQSNFYQGRGVASARSKNVQHPSQFTTTGDTLQARSQQAAYGTSFGQPHSSNPMLLPNTVGSSSQQFIRGSNNSLVYVSGECCVICGQDLYSLIPGVKVLPCCHGFHMLCLRRLPPISMLHSYPCTPCHILLYFFTRIF